MLACDWAWVSGGGWGAQVRHSYGLDAAAIDGCGTLVPRCPVLALTRALTFESHLPMELGCAYGAEYWTTCSGAVAMQPTMAVAIRAT